MRSEEIKGDNPIKQVFSVELILLGTAEVQCEAL